MRRVAVLSINEYRSYACSTRQHCCRVEPCHRTVPPEALAAEGGPDDCSYECAEAGDRTPHDERVHLAGAFVGIDRAGDRGRCGHR